MKKGLRLALLGMGFLSSAVFAQGGYLGAGFGSANYSEDNFEDSDTGLNIFGGMRFNENFALELSYMDFGKQEDSFYGYDASVEVTGLGFSVVGILPIDEKFEIFGKLGLFSWDVDVTLDSYKTSDDGSDAMIGLGAAYHINEQFDIRAEWNVIDVDGADLDMLSVGAQFNF